MKYIKFLPVAFLSLFFVTQSSIAQDKMMNDKKMDKDKMGNEMMEKDSMNNKMMDKGMMHDDMMMMRVDKDMNGVAIKGYDPVAYFTDGKAEMGKSAHSYKWNDAEWHFANADHLKMFKENAINMRHSMEASVLSQLQRMPAAQPTRLPGKL